MEASFKNRYAMAFVLITVMINSIGFGIIIPVLPDLIRELTDIPDNKIALHMGGLTFVFADADYRGLIGSFWSKADNAVVPFWIGRRLFDHGFRTFYRGAVFWTACCRRPWGDIHHG